MEREEGAGMAPEVGENAYFPLRLLRSSVSGGRTTKRPSIGKALSSIEKPSPSL